MNAMHQGSPLLPDALGDNAIHGQITRDPLHPTFDPGLNGERSLDMVPAGKADEGFNQLV